MSRRERLCGTALCMGIALVCLTAFADETAPYRVNPARPLVLSGQGVLSPADLVGYEVLDITSERDGKPYVRVGKPFRIAVHWIPRSADFGETEAVIRFEGGGAALERAFPVGAAQWRQGSVCRTEYTVEVPRFTVAGDARMILGIRPAGDEKSAFLCAATLGIVPIVTTSTYGDDRIRAAFGENAVRLRSAFRLGPGARIRLPLPDALAGPVTGIGLVSALQHGNVTQGEPVVAVESSAAPQAAAIVRAGEATSLGSIDKLRPGIRTVEKLPVFESVPDEERLAWNMKPFSRHLYVGRVYFDRPVQSGRIELRYLRDTGVIDIREIVLLVGE